MSKRDLQKRIDNESPVMSGEMVAVASVTQVQHLTIMGPYSGDFQIVDNGRLIVGQDPDIGNRGIISPYGIFGYNSSGVNVFSVWFKPAQNGGWTSGDVHAGNLAANYLLYDQSEGTLGLYTPAGAGILLDNDGSARFGHSDGGNLFWNSATESLQFRSGALVMSEIDALGNAAFTGIITATGGRITGDMQVDARLRAGDVDGPAVYIGKLVDADGAAYAGQIMVTDTENVPWFNVRTGSDGTGYLHIGRPGDYPNRLTLEVTPTDAVLTFDGTAYIALGNIAGWTITPEQLTSPTGYVALNSIDGIVITAADLGGSTLSDVGDAATIDKMITYRDATGTVLHRIEGWSDTVDGQPRETLAISTGTITGRAYHSMRAVATGEAWARLRAVGGFGLAGQQDASVHVFAYRGEAATVNHSRIELEANIVKIEPYTSATAIAGGLSDGLIMYTDGTYNPAGLGEGLYLYSNASWTKFAGPENGTQRWGDATNYAQIDGDGMLTFVGVGRAWPRIRSATKGASWNVDLTEALSYRVNSTTGAVVATLPTADATNKGTHVWFRRVAGTNNVTISTVSGGDIVLSANWQYCVVEAQDSTWERVG